MVTLGELMGCDEGEAQTRLSMRQALEAFGEPWARDIEAMMASCDDKAAQCSLNDQPTHAFLRGQASVFRRLLQQIRNAAKDNADLLRRLNQINLGELNG